MCQSCAARLHTGSSPCAVITSSSASSFRRAWLTCPLRPALTKSYSLVPVGNDPPKATSAKTLLKADLLSVKRAASTLGFLAHLLDEKGEHELRRRRGAAFDSS